MHIWYTAYSPKTKEFCTIYVIGSAVNGLYEEELLRAFLQKNSELDIIVNSSDEHLDRIHSEGGINLNNLSEEEKQKYINSVYK
jgi:hypothetical protein